MNEIEQVAKELDLPQRQVAAAQRLFAEGATIPFVARYRKDATGGLDEAQLAAIRDAVAGIAKCATRRQAILARLRQDGTLNRRLEHLLREAQSLVDLEAIYAPYKRKRKTRADVAVERGLEPLARRIYDQQSNDIRANRFIDRDRGVKTAEDAIAGALDIVASWISEHDQVRRRLRGLFAARAVVEAKVKRGKADQGQRFRDYFEFRESAKRIPSHRLLAVLRGEAVGVLSVKIRPSSDDAVDCMEQLVVRGRGPAATLVRRAVADAWKRLLAPSLETGLRGKLKAEAETAAIVVFATNVRQLLLVAPAGKRPVIAIDPGFKSGCKAVLLDPLGGVRDHCVLNLLGKSGGREKASADLKRMAKAGTVELIAVGSGTGGRECEAFVREQLPEARVVRIDESGASIYSASPIARAEFPNLDVTVRGAISIGRRLQDPLAELIKIDAGSIGVGQYQHDVDQAALQQMLDDTVVSCVNHVGVDLNRAAVPLLQYVSGVGPGLAEAIVAHRVQHGPFVSRRDLLKVPRLGPKAFEQAAGFLRIPQSANPLDATGVHPECYGALKKIATTSGARPGDFAGLAQAAKSADLEAYATSSVTVGMLRDAVDELLAGTRDPRGDWQQIGFAANVRTLDDVKPGMRLTGCVTNLTQFGAFVDIGVGRDGLIHVSEMADHYVSDPTEVVRLQQQVSVTVLGVEPARKRISLTMRSKH